MKQNLIGIKKMFNLKVHQKEIHMNSLKAKLTILSLFFVTTLMFGQVNAEKTLVKSFNLKGNDVVLLDLKGDVEVKHWNNEIMRVQMTIGIGNGSSSMLKSLITAGRYNLSSKSSDEGLVVLSPGMVRDVKIKGSKLEEKISYIVFAPEDITVKLGGDASTASSSTPPNTDSL